MAFIDTLEDEIRDEDRASAEEKAESLMRDRPTPPPDEPGTGINKGPDYWTKRRQKRQTWHEYLEDLEAWKAERAENAARHLASREDARKRREAGLEGEKLFEFAEELYDVSTGKRKTAAQIRSEKALELLTGAQRGVSATGTGFNVAAGLRAGERSAQRAEVSGEAQIASAAELQRESSGDQLRALLIQGEQRAEDKRLALEQLRFQQEQAAGGIWGDILGGILGAIGGVVGFVAGGGPAGAIAGASAGSALGKGAGRWAA